jgi:hypothetical protein
VRALQTSDATCEATCTLAERLGKIKVTTKGVIGRSPYFAMAAWRF